MKTLLPAVRSFLLLTALTGFAYPLLVTLISQAAFPAQSGGSLIWGRDGRLLGSALLAQEFKSPKYFWPRPSSANFATVASGASNLGPTSSSLKQTVTDRAAALRLAHQLPVEAPVPEELLQASGSGLDPHISAEAARFQVKRISTVRGLDEAQVMKLIQGDLVNVLLVNIALDTLH